MDRGIAELGEAGQEGRRARLRVCLGLIVALSVAVVSDYGGAWVYCGVALIAALAVSAMFLRAQGAEGLREISTDLGVAGVLWLVVSVGLITFTDGGGIEEDFPSKAAFTLVGVLLGLAALGTLLSRALPSARPAPPEPLPPPPPGYPPPPPPPPAPRRSLLEPLPVTALAATALAVVLSLVQDDGRGECGVPDPGWTDDLLSVAALAALLAAGCGIALLVQRRWVLALINLSVAPFVVLLAIWSRPA